MADLAQYLRMTDRAFEQVGSDFRSAKLVDVHSMGWGVRLTSREAPGGAYVVYIWW